MMYSLRVTRLLAGNKRPRWFSSEPQVTSTLTSSQIGLITLNHPPANAMGRVFLQQLKHEMKSMEDARCIILHSALAPKVFSAGADLKERATMTMEEAEAFVVQLRTTMQELSNLPVPVIAAIDGVAVGGGLELALAADLRVVSARSKVGLPETSLAIVPGAGGTQRLPRLIGEGRAKELIWTGRRLSGVEAAEYGLATRLVDNEESSLDTAMQLAEEIAKKGPVAIRASKWAIQEGMKKVSMENALEVERQAYARVLPTNDRLEGLAAFREGRTPNYRGE
ncbi:methylglutaconyl-CoA hydratase [Fistulifera solaris]|uniref:Methylglutaconyl-CoA hydratase n=1 Tax=Fistulifera solaris TaxID=1519565 RepID=A0A1Z5KMS7_FISSO|nr:methylglutaconyl-CoA hydratase [Fistulifera solaris]|eukprot:GAX27415.1 methylglutaconyl-CoA hydratase [Fistulifera solaris]